MKHLEASIATLSICAFFLASGCASLPVKQRAVASLQASETALGSAQDFERSLCFNTPTTESGGHCTNPLAAGVGLTDTRHQTILSMFAQAFAIEVKAAVALKAWAPGTAAPPTLATYVTELSQIVTLAQVLDPGAAMFLNYVQSALTSAQAIALW